MSRLFSEKYLFPLLVLILAYPLLSALLPVCLPFGVGLGLALAAEPAVGPLEARLHLRRGLASAMGVTGVLIAFFAAVTVLLTLATRQIARLSQFLPDLAATIREGSQLLRQWLLSLTEKLPGGLRTTLSSGIDRLFSGSFLENALQKLPQAAANFLGHLSQGMLTTVTAIISAYLFSVRLPALRRSVSCRIPEKWKVPGQLRTLRRTIFRWLAAEGKLALVALLFLSAGLMLLKIPNAPMLAGLITLVDILPLLGVGTVLIPWSVVCFLQSDAPRALGLLCLFLVIWLVRSILEPKLVGRELGLDPLVTLIAIYCGFRLAGLAGMLLAPLAAVILRQLGKTAEQP